MPRYLVNGVEAPINPLTATSPAKIAVAAQVIAQSNAGVLVDKGALKKAKEIAAGGGAGAPPDASDGGSSNTKMLVVGAGVVGLLAWAWSKHKAK